MWFVYLLKCEDGSLYTGITNDLDKRMEKHRQGSGSKYVAAKGFGRLVASKQFPNKSKAAKAEYLVKQLPRGKKLVWFSSETTG